MDEELRRLLEAILFAAARKIDLSEISKLSRHSEADVLATLTEWKSNLDVSSSATMLVQEGTSWKLTVKEKYIQVIKKVVTKTELPKSILQTLAVVAYKAPVMQSKVIKIRTNKAYDHLRGLEESQLITREKKGRSKLIKLTPKFYEYFDIDPRKLKDKFSNSGDLEKAIENKEKEIEVFAVDQKKQTEERLEKPKITLHQGVEVVDTIEIVEKLENTSGVEVVEDKVGELKVYDIPPENMTPEEKAIWDAAHPVPKKHKHHHKHPHKAPEKKEEVPATTEEPPVKEESAAVLTSETNVAEPAAQDQVQQTPAVVHKEPKKRKQKTETPAPEPTPEEKILAPQPEAPKELTPIEKIHQEAQEKTARLKDKNFEKGEGLAVTPEMETEIERKLKKILSGEDTKPDETPPPV